MVETSPSGGSRFRAINTEKFGGEFQVSANRSRNTFISADDRRAQSMMAILDGPVDDAAERRDPYVDVDWLGPSVNGEERDTSNMFFARPNYSRKVAGMSLIAKYVYDDCRMNLGGLNRGEPPR